jgi:hypothetical protein
VEPEPAPTKAAAAPTFSDDPTVNAALLALHEDVMAGHHQGKLVRHEHGVGVTEATLSEYGIESDILINALNAGNWLWRDPLRPTLLWQTIGANKTKGTVIVKRFFLGEVDTGEEA